MKIIKYFLIFIICSLLFCSCEGGDDSLTSNDVIYLNVYNWGEYISDEDDEECGLFDVNAGFEQYYKEKYGVTVKVNYSTYATNEDMYAKLTNSAVSYDIVIPSDYMIQKMIANDMLLEIDFSKLTNYGNIDESFKNMYYDPDNKFSVPYTYGMLGIIYNSEFVDESETDIVNESWNLLWNEKYAGKILQFNNPRDAFATAMFRGVNGTPLDINSHDPETWEKAIEELKKQKHILQGYVNDEIFNKMKGASAYISPYFAGDYLTMATDNNDLRFFYPSEGTNYFVDAFCIPKTSRNPELAHEYINYMIGRDPATANALYIGYASPNKAVVDSDYYREMLDYNYSIYDEDDNCVVDAWKVLYDKSKDVANARYPFNPAYEDYYKDGQVDIQAHVTALWESLKTENSTELWIHITSGVIVAGVLGFAIHSTYIRKKRSKFYRDRDRELRKQRQMKK